MHAPPDAVPSRRRGRAWSGRAVNPIAIGPVVQSVGAAPALVYQMLAAIGQGAGSAGERADVLEREGDELVVDFWTRLTLPGGVDRLVRTRERVTLRPPDTVEYQHLDGPVRGLRETITVAAEPGGGSTVTYRGAYRATGRLDALRARFLARPVIHRIMDAHFDDLRRRAEARAARSRVFEPDAATTR